MTRRVLLGTGAVVAGTAAFVGGAQLTGRLDDVADAVGLDPKPEPDPRDSRLMRRAAKASTDLLTSLEATAAQHSALALAPLISIAREHLAAVSGGSATTAASAAPPVVAGSPAEAVRALEFVYASASTDRAADCERAVSPDLARVLASMSAGLAQGTVVLQGLR